MPDASGLRIGFFVSNAFQARHYARLFAHFPKAIWLTKERDDRHVAAFGGAWKCIKTYSMTELDQGFDLLVSYGPIREIGVLDRCKLVQVQYGYAKAPYNFALWRGFADLVVAYGPYAKERFDHMAPAIALGNPRLDDWQDAAFQASSKAKLAHLVDPARKTILYAPTWGELSSYAVALPDVISLKDRYTIIVKAHHNSAYASKIPAIGPKNVHFLPDEDIFALLTITDVMISDYSGAIFDAFMVKTPVVLLDHPDEVSLYGKRLDPLTPEVAYRSLIGARTLSSGDLAGAIEQALYLDQDHPERLALRRQLFNLDGGVSQKLASAVLELVDGGYPKTQMQSYIAMGAKRDRARELRMRGIIRNCLFGFIGIGVLAIIAVLLFFLDRRGSL